MKGVVLTNGIIRADDGNRYSFELSDVVNLNGLDDLSELEVDFEPHENLAKSVCLLNQKGRVVSKCEELYKIWKFHVFRGTVVLKNQSAYTETSGRISTGLWGGVSGSINSISYSQKVFSLGNQYFDLTEHAFNAGFLENGDDILVLGMNHKGGFRVLDFKNITKNSSCRTPLGSFFRWILWWGLLLAGPFFSFVVGVLFNNSTVAEYFYIVFVIIVAIIATIYKRALNFLNKYFKNTIIKKEKK